MDARLYVFMPKEETHSFINTGFAEVSSVLKLQNFASEVCERAETWLFSDDPIALR
jgi:hypothetical protein